MKNWRNIFFNKETKGKDTLYTIRKKNNQWFVCYHSHSLQSVFYYVIYCHHRYPAGDACMVVILVVFGL